MAAEQRTQHSETQHNETHPTDAGRSTADRSTASSDAAPRGGGPAARALRTQAAPRTRKGPAAGAGQLHLLGTAPWRLPESTRQIGRQGIVEARAALRAARRPASGRPTPTSAAA